EARIYRIPDNLYNELKDKSSYERVDVKRLELVRTHKLHCPGVVPFNEHANVIVPPLPFGRYIVVGYFVNGAGEESGLVKVSLNEAITVHNITMFSAGGENFPDRVFTVDTRTGAPQQGVNLGVESRYSGNRKYNSTAITDNDGSSVLPNDTKYNYHYVTATRDNDKYVPSMTVYPFSKSDPNTHTVARVFTDLNIYRPGETMKFAAILHIITSELMSPLEDKKVRVILYDPNHKAVDTLETKSDAYGRIQGEFKIPTDRMNGSFSLYFSTDNEHLGYHSFNVSEYKAPTFIVSFPDARQVFTRNQPVKITGKAATYSGVPVPNAQVKLHLYRNEWSWWWRWSTTRGESIVDTVMTTDEKGEFTLELPASSFKENEAKHWHYNYVLEAQCTNEAGESQEASHHFIIGSRRGVTLSDKEFNNVEPIKLPLVFNSTDENEKGVECYYKIQDDKDNVVASGNINSENPVLDLTKLPSGKYKVTVNMLGDDETTSGYLTLYRMGEKTSPVKDNPLWLPSDGRKVDDKNVGHITIGS
ncbi:MAG: hypothetical protein IJK68_03805, partial [Muribaculaceae bacterium]|nr:hypothetical protein [Muribaculaceae bacterium]